MIIARLNGQLGNQMFIYATAYATARDTKEKLSVYKYEYDTVAKGFVFQLDDLMLDGYNRYLGIPHTLYMFTTRKFISKILRKLLRKTNAEQSRFADDGIDIIREKVNAYTPINIDQSKSVHLLDGFWQSPQYFDTYRSDIVRQFRPRFRLSDETEQYLSRIEEDEYPVSLHVRRGDYEKLGWCIPLEYYSEAIQRMKDAHPNARFYIFSDDIPWVKENLNISASNAVFVEHSKRVKPFEDIWIMSKCKSNIIANSSFSWWGAYLNQNMDKEVIAPSLMQKTNNTDIFCSDWIVLRF